MSRSWCTGSADGRGRRSARPPSSSSRPRPWASTYVANLAFRPGGFAWPADFVLIPLFFPVVFVGAYIGSRWGLRALRTRPVALIFILVLFLAAGKLLLDLL